MSISFQNGMPHAGGHAMMYSPTAASDSSGFSERDSGISTRFGAPQPPPFRPGGMTAFHRSESPNFGDRIKSPGETIFFKKNSAIPASFCLFLFL